MESKSPEIMIYKTERQKREEEYYNKYVGLLNVDDISFDPICSESRRPWNSYWRVYELAKYYYNDGKRNLLDFGCGCGISSVRFAKIGYDVSGFDISENNIDVGGKLAKKYGLDHQIKLSLQIAEQLNYPSNHFDIIIGFDILHHVDIKKAIPECLRVLKSNGIAIFREPVEVPLLDYVRNTKIVKYIAPNEKNFTPGIHITDDERKLMKSDIDIIRNIFNDTQEVRFTFISRFDRFLRKYYGRRSSPLEIIDYVIFKLLPITKSLGGDAVFLLEKK